MRVPLTISYFHGDPDAFPAWGARACLVADRRTHAVMGQRLEGRVGRVLVLPDPVHADEATVTRVRTESADCDGLLAVGSGTLGDLCKYASHLDGKPYVVLPTAPSMNGYVSANASITVGGHKQTLPAHLPEAVLVDTAVLAAAPPRLIRAGLGDVLCRTTAQADWVLSHLLLGTPYDPAPFEWLAPLEAVLLERAADVMRGDRDAMKTLIDALLVSGWGMTHCGGSYPASQGEHLIAHTFEMLHPPIAHASYHGEQIAVTTLSMARMQEEILKNPPVISDYSLNRERVTAHLPASVWEGFEAKRARIGDVASFRAKVLDSWQHVCNALTEIMLPLERLEATLAAAGCPLAPESLGWPPLAYAQAMRLAPYTRDRFTFLDLAAMRG